MLMTESIINWFSWLKWNMQSPLVFWAAYRQQLVKFPFLPQQEVWKGHTGDSELANKPACQLTHFNPLRCTSIRQEHVCFYFPSSCATLYIYCFKRRRHFRWWFHVRTSADVGFGSLFQNLIFTNTSAEDKRPWRQGWLVESKQNEGTSWHLATTLAGYVGINIKLGLFAALGV